jgi:hypothetical protein
VRRLRRCARLPRVRGGAPHSHACSRVGCRCKPKHLASARRSFGPRPRRAACASRAWALMGGCADQRARLCVHICCTGVWSSRGGGRGGLAPPVAPRTLLHIRLAGGRGAPTPHTPLINAAHCCMHPPPPPELPLRNQRTPRDPPEYRPTRVPLGPWQPRLHTLTPAHSPFPLSTPTCCTSLPCEMEDFYALNI